MSTGEAIKKARINAGFTQKQLGEHLGITSQSIAQWETGRREPKYETLQKIAAALNVPVSTFLPKRDIKEILAENIESARCNAGLTLQEIANRINIPVSAVSRFERGERMPRYEVLQDLAVALGVSVEYLATDHSQQPPFAGYAGDNNKLITPGSDLAAIIDKVSQMLNAADGQHPAGENINALLQDYSALNAPGQQKALERVHELTEVPRYRREDPDPAPVGSAEPTAAKPL